MRISLYSNHQGTKVKIIMDFEDNNLSVSQYVEPQYILTNLLKFLTVDMKPWTVSRSYSNEDVFRILVKESQDFNEILEVIKDLIFIEELKK